VFRFEREQKNIEVLATYVGGKKLFGSPAGTQ
jgi:hypothetical protein